MWFGPDGCVLYRGSRLLAWRGLLLGYPTYTESVFGPHRLDQITGLNVFHCPLMASLYLSVESKCERGALWTPGWVGRMVEPMWSVTCKMQWAGLGRVRVVQRWWRAARWRWRAKAFMMGAHPRLGERSPLKGVDQDLLQLCVAALLV
jgi:hypothetical protein